MEFAACVCVWRMRSHNGKRANTNSRAHHSSYSTRKLNKHNFSSGFFSVVVATFFVILCSNSFSILSARPNQSHRALRNTLAIDENKKNI